MSDALPVLLDCAPYKLRLTFERCVRNYNMANGHSTEEPAKQQDIRKCRKCEVGHVRRVEAKQNGIDVSPKSTIAEATHQQRITEAVQRQRDQKMNKGNTGSLGDVKPKRVMHRRPKSNLQIYLSLRKAVDDAQYDLDQFVQSCPAVKDEAKKILADLK